MNRREALKLSGAALAGLYKRPAAPAPMVGPPPVYVVLWFDTEDYILPASDDAAKRIAAFLTAQGIRATFKVVGEKARTLERRRRGDVIGALSRHEIGYHSDTHSQHPTVAEYESTLDWDTGVREFDRRERPGYDDVKRIFGQAPTCYGQPGSSWAPQPYAALKKWGVNVYLDEAPHVGLEGKPFYYGGLLNIFNTREGPQLRPNDNWSNLEAAEEKFQAFYVQMTSRPPGGLISLYYHPAEFVHQQFWDAVNFAHGANPPRAEWKLPPLKTPGESEKAFQYLEGLVAYMKSFPHVEFVTASEAYALYPDTAQNRVFSREDLNDISSQVEAGVNFQLHDGYTLAAGEVLAVLNRFVANVVSQRPAQPVRLDGTPYGPASPAPTMAKAFEVGWDQFSRTTLDVAGFIDTQGRIPDVVWLGSTAVPPDSYVVALASVTQTLLAKSEAPETVTLAPASFAAARYVATDSPALWDWVIFPPGFDAPRLMDLARLQAWTLKPARLSDRHLRSWESV